MTLPITTYPEPILRENAKPVTDITDEMIRLSDDMAETMYFSSGIGLAAPQVGKSCCLITADIGDGLITLFNPEIVSVEGKESGKEGCLSVPDVMLDIKRATKIVVQGLNRDGKEITLEVNDLMARVIQHEVDHLSGTLIIDRVSKTHLHLISGKLKKLRRKFARGL